MPPTLNPLSKAVFYAIKPVKAAVNLLLSVLPDKTRLYLSATDKHHRYHRVLKEMKALGGTTILEVGGGSEGLALFHKGRITILDISPHELRKARKAGHDTILADGCDIPLKAGSFDIAVSVASLEHVPREKRKKYTDELKRVCRRGVVLYVPAGKHAERFDRSLLNFRSFLGMKDDWAEEHVKYGLPTIAELENMFPGCRIEMMQNTKLWLSVMKIEAIPIINLMVPGMYYALRKGKDRSGPYYGAIVVWKKRGRERKEKQTARTARASPT